MERSIDDYNSHPNPLLSSFFLFLFQLINTNISFDGFFLRWPVGEQND